MVHNQSQEPAHFHTGREGSGGRGLSMSSSFICISNKRLIICTHLDTCISFLDLDDVKHFGFPSACMTSYPIHVHTPHNIVLNCLLARTSAVYRVTSPSYGSKYSVYWSLVYWQNYNRKKLDKLQIFILFGNVSTIKISGSVFTWALTYSTLRGLTQWWLMRGLTQW